MAFFAVCGKHFRRVRFVAYGALRDLAVDFVTDRTIKNTMLALIVAELSNLLRVAGAALICNFAGKRHLQRYMGVHMTVEASLKLEMGLSLMALDALRNLSMDRMTGVAVNCAVLAFMLPEFSILLNVTVETNTFVC